MKVPEVSIAITDYKSKNVYILGEVAQPGKYPMKGDVISLRDAIVAAGLPTREAALRRVHIIKYNSGKTAYRKIDLFRLLYKGKLKYNIDLMAVTKGAAGSTLISDKKADHYKLEAKEVFDTLGAGDAFASILCIGYLQNWELSSINNSAN